MLKYKMFFKQVFYRLLRTFTGLLNTLFFGIFFGATWNKKDCVLEGSKSLGK